MRKSFFIIITIILFIVVILIYIKAYPISIIKNYQFDSTSKLIGCGISIFYFQKISKNSQHELIIKINKIDSLPIKKEFVLNQYSKFINVYYNEYPEENKYINEICNDMRDLNKKPLPPNKYYLKTGKILIEWDKSKMTISIQIKNILFEDHSKNQIHLGLENFKNINVGWSAG